MIVFANPRPAYLRGHTPLHTRGGQNLWDLSDQSHHTPSQGKKVGSFCVCGWLLHLTFSFSKVVCCCIQNRKEIEGTKSYFIYIFACKILQIWVSESWVLRLLDLYKVIWLFYDFFLYFLSPEDSFDISGTQSLNSSQVSWPLFKFKNLNHFA